MLTFLNALPGYQQGTQKILSLYEKTNKINFQIKISFFVAEFVLFEIQTLNFGFCFGDHYGNPNFFDRNCIILKLAYFIVEHDKSELLWQRIIFGLYRHFLLFSH